MTSRSDQQIKTSQHTLHHMWEMMGQDYDTHVRVGALQTYTAELATLSRDGLVREQDRGLIHGLHGIMLAIEANLKLAQELCTTFKPLHRDHP